MIVRALAFLLVFAFPALVLAGDDRVRVFSAAEFSVILEKDAGGEPTGIARDILSRISDEIGVRIEIKFYPWKRALWMAENGAVDGIVGAYRTAKRQEFLDYSEMPFFVDRMVVIARKDWKGDWDGDWRNLKGEKLLEIRGWAYGDEFETAKKLLNVKVVNNIKDGMREVILKRSGILVANERDALSEIEREGYGKIRIIEPAFKVNEGYFAFSKKVADSDYQHRFDAALHQMWQTGETARLLTKYGLPIPFYKY